MSKKARSAHKVISRLDKLDQASIQNYILGLVDSNQLYTDILNQLDDGILIIDEACHVQFVNSQCLQWFDIPHSEDLPRIPIRDLIPDESLLETLEKNIPVIKAPIHEDVLLFNPRERALQASLYPLSSSQKKETLVVLKPQNVQHLSLNYEEKMKRIKSLVNLASGIAHEIGNPLNSIMIHLQLLQKKIDDLSPSKKKELSQTLDTVHSETQRLDNIIRNFLKATRHQKVKFKMENLNSIIEEATSFLRPEFEAHNITLDLKMATTIPSFLMDRERLYQSLMNLLKNALEAMPRGGHVTLKTLRKGRVASIQIKDTGCGIKDRDFDRIFEPYFTTKSEGSGLGLLVVHHAIQDHGGRVEVKSSPDKGTTFIIDLPIRLPQQQLSHTHN